MWENVVWLVLLGVFVAVMVTYCVNASVKEKKVLRKKRTKEEAETNRILAARFKDQLEKLRQHHFVVSIREKDGRKSSFEAILIAGLIRHGLIVEYLTENDWQVIVGGGTKLLANGLFALVGTSWHRSRRQDPDWSEGRESEFTYCDYRLLAAADDGKGKILAAGCEGMAAYWEEPLADRIVEHIAETVFPAAAS